MSPENPARFDVIEREMGLKPYTTFEEVVRMLGRWAFKNKFYYHPTDGADGARRFTRPEIIVIARNDKHPDGFNNKYAGFLERGHIYLTSDTRGIISLETDGDLRTWIFTKKGSRVNIEYPKKCPVG